MGRGAADNSQAISLMPRLRSIGPRPSPAYGKQAKDLSDLLRNSVNNNADEVIEKMEKLVRYYSPTLLKANYRIDEQSLKALQTCASWSHDGLSGRKSVLTDDQAGSDWILSSDQGGRELSLDSASWSANDRIAYGHLSAATGMGRIRLAGALDRLIKARGGDPHFIEAKPIHLNRGPIRMNKGRPADEG